ncbi:3-methyladenine DNA glycosylase [Sesbania bispinosa]|nr:3-methyladenine DNA glycosylase [Sesbania bispinosa]
MARLDKLLHSGSPRAATLAAGVWDGDEGASVNGGSMRMGESVAALDEEDGGTHRGSTMPLWGLLCVVRSQRR